MKPNTRSAIAIGLVALVGVVVVSRLVIALKLTLASIPLLILVLWVLLIPAKVFAFLKVRDWWGARMARG